MFDLYLHLAREAASMGTVFSPRQVSILVASESLIAFAHVLMPVVLLWRVAPLMRLGPNWLLRLVVQVPRMKRRTRRWIVALALLASAFALAAGIDRLLLTYRFWLSDGGKAFFVAWSCLTACIGNALWVSMIRGLRVLREAWAQMVGDLMRLHEQGLMAEPMSGRAFLEEIGVDLPPAGGR